MIMKRAFIMFLAVIFVNNISSAQVLINLQLPQAGISIKSQLWSITLTNTSNASLPIRIRMIMTDLSTGQVVLSGTTNLLQLERGNKILQYNDVIPVNYSVLNTNYNVDMAPNGFLPIGNFNVCYEIVKQAGEVFESIGEECATIEIEPVSPPFLNSPDDHSEVVEKRPLFMWLPPAPINLFNNLSYNLRLVEILPNQNSSNAIQQNFPVISQNYIAGLTFQYPSSYAALDTGKAYAWQITANNNNLLIAKSDIWAFKIQGPAIDNFQNRETSYFKLRTEPSSSYFVCEGVLKFEYTNEVNDSLVSIRIYDLTPINKKLIRLENDEMLLRFGQNLLEIDLKNSNGIINGHLYSIELINSRKEVWNGRFKYKTIN